MKYRGVVKNGVVVLPEGERLPDGTEVDVQDTSAAKIPSQSEVPAAANAKHWLLEFAGIIKDSDLPVDGSINHDHYIYGTPKRQ